MPLVNGVCIPPICYTVKYNVAAADVEIFDARRGRVDPNRTNAARQGGLFVAQVAAYKAKYAAPLALDCDGCRCFKPPQPLPWAPMPPEDIPPQAPPPGVPPPPPPRFQPRINGGLFQLHLGFCLPPGARIRFPGGEWQEASGPHRRPEYAMSPRGRRPAKRARGTKSARGKRPRRRKA
jgi:hypothetical protein